MHGRGVEAAGVRPPRPQHPPGVESGLRAEDPLARRTAGSVARDEEVEAVARGVVERHVDTVTVASEVRHGRPAPYRNTAGALEQREQLGPTEHDHRTDACREHRHVHGLQRPTGAVGERIGVDRVAFGNELGVRVDAVQYATAERVQADRVALVDARRAFDDDRCAALLGQPGGERQAGNTGADDQDTHPSILPVPLVVVRRRRRAPAPPSTAARLRTCRVR